MKTTELRLLRKHSFTSGISLVSSLVLELCVIHYNYQLIEHPVETAKYGPKYVGNNCRCWVKYIRICNVPIIYLFLFSFVSCSYI